MLVLDLGNKLAGVLGEAAQAEPVKTELVANRSQITQFVPDSVINNGNDINIKAIIYVNNLVAMNSPRINFSGFLQKRKRSFLV